MISLQYHVSSESCSELSQNLKVMSAPRFKPRSHFIENLFSSLVLSVPGTPNFINYLISIAPSQAHPSDQKFGPLASSVLPWQNEVQKSSGKQVFFKWFILFQDCFSALLPVSINFYFLTPHCPVFNSYN